MDLAIRVPEEIYQVGDLCIDVGRHRVTRNGIDIPLPNLSFALLLALVRAHPRMLTTDELLDTIWAPAVVNPETVGQRVKLLRQALGDDPRAPRYVVGVRGLGYRMDVPVARVELPANAAASPVTSLPNSAVQSAPGGSAPRLPVLQLRVRKSIWAFAALGLLGLAWYVVHRVDSLQHAPVAASSQGVAPRKPRLAILPFENLSPDPNNAFFADGLHEELVSRISEEVPGVEVVSRTTMMSYRAAQPKSLATVAQELAASHLIEGSVRREGDRVRMTVQLIDGRTDAHIWSASYDRTLQDALTLESQVAEDIARQLLVRLSRPPRREAAVVRDTRAFDLYLKALLALRTFQNTAAQFGQIDDLLSRAIARQPDFALAYAQRARLRTLMFISSADTSEASVAQIRADLDAARRLAPQDPIVIAVYGYFLMCTNDTSGALAAYAAAEAAGLAEPEFLIPKAHMLLRRSRMEELNATVQHMLALDPADPLMIQFATYDFYLARQPVEALQAATYARHTFPSLYGLWRGWLLLDFAGRVEELRSAIELYEAATDPAALTNSLSDYFDLLRFEHRYRELRTRIDRVPVAASNYLSGVNFGPIGQTPTALFRGWTDLLIGDRTAAAQDGRAVLRFVQQQRKTPWNAAHLRALAAAGYTFIGECWRARAAARDSLGFLSRADDAVIWNFGALRAADVYAWCGAPDEAVRLLRAVSSGRPGVGPMSIARDPLFTVPLGKDPAFHELSRELERDTRDIEH